jgi:hypothetical protein
LQSYSLFYDDASLNPLRPSIKIKKRMGQSHILIKRKEVSTCLEKRSVSERPNKPKKPLIPAWFGTLVVILIVLCFAVALLLWKPWAPVKPKGQITSEHYQEEIKALA